MEGEGFEHGISEIPYVSKMEKQIYATELQITTF